MLATSAIPAQSAGPDVNSSRPQARWAALRDIHPLECQLTDPAMLRPREQKPARGTTTRNSHVLQARDSMIARSLPKRTSEPSIRFQLHEAGAGLRRQTAITKCKAMDRPDPYQERAREMAPRSWPRPRPRAGAFTPLLLPRSSSVSPR